ncbi:MAG: hypothetical protein HYU67_02240 [Flavobacteriia bacterium]|nr:hypothetical protein [Flavobacteriia bacterium]
MNKFLNILLIIIHFPIILFCIIIGFNFPIDFFNTSGDEIPYKFEIFISIASFIGLIFLYRSVQRWIGIQMLNQKHRFQWNIEMDKSRVNQVFLYLILESLVQVFIGIGLYQLTTYALPLSIVLFLFSLDHLVLAFLGKYGKKFRVGMTKKVLLAVDRDLKSIYFQGLSEVDIQQQSIFFDYINDLQLSIPSDAIPLNKRTEFFLTFEKLINREKVYFSESFKSFSNS